MSIIAMDQNQNSSLTWALPLPGTAPDITELSAVDVAARGGPQPRRAAQAGGTGRT